MYACRKFIVRTHSNIRSPNRNFRSDINSNRARSADQGTETLLQMPSYSLFVFIGPGGGWRQVHPLCAGT